MDQDFAGKIALVTGSSGIGLGAALRLARGGARVFVCGNDKTHNKKAAEAAEGLSVSVALVDVSEENSVRNWIMPIGEAESRIDVLVNAAAIQTYGDISSTDSAHWDKVMAINLRSCFLTSHHAYSFMRTGGGSIVHVSSVQGHSNQNNVLAYATTKGAIHAMTRAMAVDCAKDKVRVNSISPGSVRTPLLEFAAQEVVGAGNDIEPAIAQFGAAHPIGRVGTVDETSELIAFLCNEKSGFCTGGDYLADGGLLAHLGV
ncbi:MAG: SDR family oxidoreductase [Hyphomicrobiales bacterium]|jgi:meso-butanediol dehydrogenase/(S,S)-butanediol dehydrogenase/diacetyl reductase